MAKIVLDKYYTSDELAKYCIDVTKRVIGEENITEYLEPSAGAGAFSKQLTNCLAFDIEPESDNIVKQDYLELDIPYKSGRCVIGNPPYGKGNYLSVKFFKKSIQLSDFVSFILPISQLNNNMYMYEFDLIHSDNLGKQPYSGRNVHCCLNIYRRNPNGYNLKPNYDLHDVVLKGVATGASRNDKVPTVYDFSICAFGSSIGKLCEYDGQYCQQTYVTINDPTMKHVIKEMILTVDWKSMYDMTGTPKLNHWMIYKFLKEQLPNLK